MFFLVPEGPNVYSYQINQRFGLQRSPMLPHDIALLWSAITHWAEDYKHLAALRPEH